MFFRPGRALSRSCGERADQKPVTTLDRAKLLVLPASIRRPKLARKRAAEPADYQGKQRVTDSHEILGRSRPTTREEEQRAQPDCSDVFEPQDLTIKTCLENDVSILHRLVVAIHQAQHLRAPHIFECSRLAPETFFFGRTNYPEGQT
jgi:hypothetical protein